MERRKLIVIEDDAGIRRGLTLGKYAPLHRGHQSVIETGLAEMDEMVVMIYDAPETTSVPLAVRAAWIREMYPDAEVVEAWDGPTEVGYSPELKRAHEAYIRNALGPRKVTHFYSSEPYGEHVSRALDAVDRRVDVARRRVPVSATQIRAEPFRYRQCMTPRVYRDLITNVVFLGAPCSGKTTLAERLAQEFGTRWMPEYGREYWEAHHVERRLTPTQLVEIAEGHIEGETRMLQEANRYLFTDTNAITTLTFARYYHGVAEPRLMELADQAVIRYDLTFVCAIDFPYQESRDRSGEANRAAFQNQVLEDLAWRKVPYVLLSGSVERRIDCVRGLLQRFRKYMNLADLRRSIQT
jgi:HTH-type transcriptional regulator, transcriptional repressor of NAD biosynthesis genes